MENYEKFLNILTEDLDKMFKHQKEHICCKEGCSYCCERGNFPFSQLEFDYLMLGFDNLPPNIQKEIRQNIQQIKTQNLKSYTCPFLINKKCSLYNHRGLICRTFGLLIKDFEGTMTIPFCAGMGLNYSKFYDTNKANITNELLQSVPYKTPPKMFNIGLNNIMSLDLVKDFGLEFGEVKRLIDWFE